MTTLHDQIIGYATEWVTGRLCERQPVSLPGIGTFTPEYLPDYILAHPDGTYTLMPPDVVVDFQADPFLLRDKHYTTLEVTLPGVPPAPEMVTAVADLHGLESSVVTHELSEHFTLFFTQLFRGRRVQLLGLADFFISEESGHLLLNIDGSPRLHETLSYPFRPYKPVPIRPDQIPSDTEVYDSERAPLLRQVPIVQTTTAQPPEPPAQAEEIIVTPEPISPVAQKEMERRPRRRFYLWLTVGFLLVGAVALLLYRRYVTSPTPIEVPTAATDPVPKPVPTVPDSLSQTESAITEALPKPLPIATDTLGSGESLAQLARRHYHRTIDWVYIYIQNSAHLDDANNIPPGTILEIPDLAAFDLKEDSSEAVTEAREWAALILSGGFTSYTDQRPTLPSNK